MNPLFIAGAIAILAGLHKAATSPKVPQSPAACGISFLIATAGIASWQYLLAIIPSYTLYMVASLISLPVFSIFSGYVAARTTENTAPMNAKIIAGAAFMPYIIITYISLISLPSWTNYYATLIFIPCIILGLKLMQIHSKSSNNGAQTTRSPY